MTIKELSQLYYLGKEIQYEQLKLDKLKLCKDDKSLEIEEQEKIIECNKQLHYIEHNRLLRYIYSVEDSLVRQILSLRFVNGLSWLQVSFSIGGGNTKDGVKKIVYRFLERG